MKGKTPEGGILKLDLLENAIDSIVHGLEHYVKGKENAKNYKFAILHVAQGVELILKERLRQEHWVLIYEKVEKPSTSKTVDFETAVGRLQSICSVALDKYIDGLRTLRKARHEIEHYKVKLSEEEAAVLIGSNIPSLFEFLEGEIKTALQEHIKDEETWQELLTIEYVFSKAITKAHEEIASVYSLQEKDQEYPMIVGCPMCGLQYIVIKGKLDKEAKCLLCKHVSELRECMRCYKLFAVDELFTTGDLCLDCETYLNQPNT
jgi:hypothetical protein